MKKLLLALAVATMTACTSDNTPEAEATGTTNITFTIEGDFSDDWKPVTRGYLSADGKDLTDVWVLDYDADGHLLQQLHQNDNTAEDFGKPVMNLAYGAHQVYFIASRGVDPVLNTDAHTITVVTKLRLTFTDEVPATANSISIVPHTWYYGLDYTTGQPASPQTDAATVITIPDASKGQTGIQASLFGFSGADEWNTDVVISSRTSTDDVLGSATIASAPFKVNRVSDYSGPLFSAGGSMSLSLNGEWDDSYQGTW